jgi:hypothetical protein
MNIDLPSGSDPDRSSTLFRVRIEGLKPGIIYHYTVESEKANGTSDGVKSTLKQFRIDRQSSSASGRPAHH